MLASPIGWVGGKRLLRKQILDRIPDHTCYVELFAGAAWICFAKPKELSKVEVINDTNGELSNFWRCVRDKHLELIEKLRFRIASKEDFEMIKQSWGWGGGGALIAFLKWIAPQYSTGTSKMRMPANTGRERSLLMRLLDQPHFGATIA